MIEKGLQLIPIFVAYNKADSNVLLHIVVNFPSLVCYRPGLLQQFLANFIFGVKSSARQGPALWVASKYFLLFFLSATPLT